MSSAIPTELVEALRGRYRIEREVGAGGMATVYLAEDIKHHRQVALKVLRADLTASLGKERFVREVGIAASLQHPHVLPLYDSGEAGGLLYYVMPYVDGPSLRQKLIKEGELPVTDAVRILRDVADALAEAHKFGIVHRDLKPENVMLRGRHALVADFGVAKALSDATGSTSLTSVGIALGTPTYMAPEQATADPHMDHRADIYAFGVVAYELLAGRPPFTGQTPQQVLAAHITASVEPVTTHRALPPALAALVMKCLEKKPADRVQSAEELIPQLEAVLTASGGMTPAQTAPSRSAPSARRSWIPVALGAVVAVGIIVYALTRNRASGAAATDHAGRVAIFPFLVRGGDSSDVWLAEGLAEQIGSRLARGAALQVLSPMSISSQLRRTAEPLEAARALAARWVITGQLRFPGNAVQAHIEVAGADSGVQMWSRTFERSDGDFRLLEAEVAESVAVALLGSTAKALLSSTGAPVGTNDPEAYRFFLLAKAQLNRRTPETAIEAAKNFTEATRRDPNFASAWGGLGATRGVQFSWLAWRADVPRDSLPTLARAASARALEIDPNNAMGLFAIVTYATWVDGDFEKAREFAESALRRDSLNADLWHTYAMIAVPDRGNDLKAARSRLRRSIELDPVRPNTWKHLGLTVAWDGYLADAEAILDTCVALEPWAPAHEARAIVRNLRGNGLGALKDQRAADRLNGTVDTMRLALYSVTTGDRAAAERWLSVKRPASFNVARLEIALGRAQDALTTIEELRPDARMWSNLHDPLFAPIKNDARFKKMLRKSHPPGAPAVQ